MTIEPPNTNPLTIGVLIHENKSLKSTLEILTREHDDLQKRHIQQFEDYEKRIKVQQHLILRVQEECKRDKGERDSAYAKVDSLRQQQQRLDDNLQFTRGQLLRCRGFNQTLKEQVETHEKTIDILNAQLDGSREANQILSNKNKELEKLLVEEREAYIRLKGLRHAANYGVGAQQFKEIMLKKSSNEQTATEVLEIQTLKREVNRLSMKELELNVELAHSKSKLNEANTRTAELAKLHSAAIAQSVKFANELIAERTAHNKLKALCNERGFGTPLFYTPPALQTHKWVVCFYRDGLEVGTITYTHSPTTSKLNAIQESLNATSWKLTYSHD